MIPNSPIYKAEIVCMKRDHALEPWKGRLQEERHWWTGRRTPRTTWEYYTRHGYHVCKWNTFYYYDITGNTLSNSQNDQEPKIYHSDITQTNCQYIIWERIQVATNSWGWAIWMLKKTIEAVGSMLNISRCDELVPEVERYIQTRNERVWETINKLPFEKLPPSIICGIVYNAVFWLTCFPEINGIHPKCRWIPIVTG